MNVDELLLNSPIEAITNMSDNFGRVRGGSRPVRRKSRIRELLETEAPLLLDELGKGLSKPDQKKLDARLRQPRRNLSDVQLTIGRYTADEARERQDRMNTVESATAQIDSLSQRLKSAEERVDSRQYQLQARMHEKSRLQQNNKPTEHVEYALENARAQFENAKEEERSLREALDRSRHETQLLAQRFLREDENRARKMADLREDEQRAAEDLRVETQRAMKEFRSTS